MTDQVIVGVVVGAVVAGIASVLVALIYAGSSRGRYRAEAALRNTEREQIINDATFDLLRERDVKIERLERQYKITLLENKRLEDRVASVEENDRMKQEQLDSLEKDHIKLRKQYNALRDKVDRGSDPRLMIGDDNG